MQREMKQVEASNAPKGNIVRQTVVAVLVIGIVGLTLGLAADRFADYELEQHAKRVSRPHVEQTFPIAGDTAPADLRSVRVELFLPTTGAGVDADSLSGEAVRLVDVATGQRVVAQATAAADGASVTLTPAAPLAPEGLYVIEVTDVLRDTAGATFVPFSAEFKTGIAADSGPRPDVAFERGQTIKQLEQSIITAMVWQPGEGEVRRLLAASADGRIFQFDIGSDGVEEAQTVMTMFPNNGGPRLVTGLAFDPRDPSRLWVSHTQMAFTGADDFTGKLSVLSGPGFASYEDRVVGLPRAFKDHANFDIAFDPKDPDTLYVSQGSNTGHGGRDTKWNNRPERPLTAAILEGCSRSSSHRRSAGRRNADRVRQSVRWWRLRPELARLGCDRPCDGHPQRLRPAVALDGPTARGDQRSDPRRQRSVAP